MKPSRPKTPVTSVFDLVSQPYDAEAEKTAVVKLKDYEGEAMEFLKTAGSYQGISTGFDSVDARMGSFLPGELFTIGGDTGHGKSIFAMNIAQNVYKSTGKPVLMVNLELTRNQAVQRFYSLSGEDHDYDGILIQKASAVKYKDIDILMKKAKVMGAGLVVIDHLHFFSRSAENSVQELSRIMKHFKECAVANDLPVILLSHVTPTRIMGQDGNVKKVQKPGLHNFKGSSSIEQDSDMVGFVYRSEDNTSDMVFYLRKNRSRPLDTSDAELTQVGWKIHEGSHYNSADYH